LACEINESIAQESDFEEILKKYYTTTLNWATEHRDEFKFMEQFNSSPYLKKIAEDEIQKYVKPLKQLLQNAVDGGILKNLDLEILFTLISGHTFSINQYLIISEPQESKREQIISETFDLLWQMISA
jgi:hypothetical protein